jgi:hypothetical protein
MSILFCFGTMEPYTCYGYSACHTLNSLQTEKLNLEELGSCNLIWMFMTTTTRNENHLMHIYRKPLCTFRNAMNGEPVRSGMCKANSMCSVLSSGYLSAWMGWQNNFLRLMPWLVKAILEVPQCRTRIGIKEKKEIGKSLSQTVH